ncbi:alpha-ketoglutarate dependent xanthine dioxygenase [Naematelia encephala]|uniref:Alpha-ketoglutarate dependent xanthine dioxygenase n=1 Tax=Naematelia encephala TaxID=71784 RepID=A0A1Y2ANP6_9TREE|nr:alpha-ketoglutarate dependent xanthine dioxygenase [Naematelia encephala]
MKVTPVYGGGTDDLGCIVQDLDCNVLTDDDFAQLEKALYTYKVVVVKDQLSLTPEKQLELNRRFDLGAREYGHANDSQRAKASILSKDGVTIPSVPQVQILGEGPLDITLNDHYKGLEGAVLTHPTHGKFHRDHLTPQQLAEGKTRFYRWHIDAALYAKNPPIVTTLLGIRNPNGDMQTVLYDDGTGDELKVTPGATAFVSGSTALDSLPTHLRSLALNSRITYAPHPYTFISPCRAHSTGLIVHSENLETPLEDLPQWSEDDLLTVPLVWTNPITGEKSLMVHGCCVWRLCLKMNEEDEGREVTDLKEVREIIYELMRPGIAPKNVYAHAWEDGDLAIFYNRGVWHSVTGQDFGPRLMHQCNLASPTPIS